MLITIVGCYQQQNVPSRRCPTDHKTTDKDKKIATVQPSTVKNRQGKYFELRIPTSCLCPSQIHTELGIQDNEVHSLGAQQDSDWIYW